MALSIIESLAFQARRVMEVMPGFDTVAVTGGGTHNKLLLQIKSNVLGRRLLIVNEDLAGYGAALTAAKAIGLNPRTGITFDEIEPDSVGIYEEKYNKWLSACVLLESSDTRAMIIPHRLNTK